MSVPECRSTNTSIVVERQCESGCGRGDADHGWIIPPSLWKLPVRFALTIDARGVSVNNKMPLFAAR